MGWVSSRMNMAKYTPPDLYCIVTGKPAEYHHIKTRGSGGPDEEWNMIPISREIHTLWGNKGNSYMCQHFPQIKSWMVRRGWRCCPVLHKWVYDPNLKD
jgi:hypothetical protein